MCWLEDILKQSEFFLFIVGKQLCDDEQRILSKCSCLSPAAKHHAWAGDSCSLSGKGKVLLLIVCMYVEFMFLFSELLHFSYLNFT